MQTLIKNKLKNICTPPNKKATSMDCSDLITVKGFEPLAVDDR